MRAKRKVIFLVSPDERDILYNAGDRAPLGILYLSAALTKNGILNCVFDLNHQDYNVFLEAVKQQRPDDIGLSIPSSPSYKQIKRIAGEIKSDYPKINVFVGGPHVSAIPDCLEGIADASVVGYGEEAILKAVNGKRGIIEEKADINKHPIPDRTKLDSRLYSMFTGDLRTATIVTSRGCPFSCVYCANHQRKVEYREPDNIEEEIKLLKKQGYEAVYILDENFVVKEKHFVSVAQVMKDNKMKYRMEMRASDVTREKVKLFKETGCIETAIGIESGNDEMLMRTNKKTTVETNTKAIEIFHEYGIPVKGFFILGLPGETYETARQTIDYAEKMRNKGLTHADFYALTPFPGSDIWENPGKFGIKILSKDFDKYLQKEDPVIETEDLENQQIKELLQEARSRWKQ